MTLHSVLCKTAALLSLVLATVSAQAAHTSASLLLDLQTARPGDTVMAGVRLQMDPHWHTYWKNPGGTGMATDIQWKLPPGITAGEILWPVPEKLPEQEFTTYIFEKEAVLLVPLKLAPNISPGQVALEANVSWLECEVQCVPGDAQVRATLTIGSEPQPGTNAAVIEKWQSALPQSGTALKPSARWEKSSTEDLRPVLLEVAASGSVSQPDFFPYPSDDFEVQPNTEVVSNADGKVVLRKQVKKYSGKWPEEIRGLIVYQSEGKTAAYETSFALPGSSATAGSATSGSAAAAGDSGARVASPNFPPLWQMLLYAFIGGLILNIMPCVLPVIALKILGFVSQSRDEPRRVKFLGLVYAGGVLLSFLALAALVIGVKAAGHSAGWGMQFGNPQFLVVLTVLVTLVALNLFGLFEINPGARVMSAAGTVAQKHGASGAFFNGVLATILATPCTAPFLGVALGFAFAQSATLIILIFLTVGAGLAFPYVLLSWNPAWLRFLPKPGAWMENFKVAMGFPMLATAVWLFSLLPIHYGERSWWLGILLVFVGFAAWIYGRFVQRGEGRRLALVSVVVLLAGAYFFVAEAQLDWRKPQAAGIVQASTVAPSGPVDWKPWSAEAVSAARAQGRPVLVDFTARWCLTCNTIVKPALESASVSSKLKEINAVALLGDYTLFPKNITEELNRYGRAGVPLVLVFPKDSAKPAIVLPEAVTPAMVVSALEQAIL